MISLLVMTHATHPTLAGGRNLPRPQCRGETHYRMSVHHSPALGAQDFGHVRSPVDV